MHPSAVLQLFLFASSLVYSAPAPLPSADPRLDVRDPVEIRAPDREPLLVKDYIETYSPIENRPSIVPRRTADTGLRRVIAQRTQNNIYHIISGVQVVSSALAGLFQSVFDDANNHGSAEFLPTSETWDYPGLQLTMTLSENSVTWADWVDEIRNMIPLIGGQSATTFYGNIYDVHNEPVGAFVIRKFTAAMSGTLSDSG